MMREGNFEIFLNREPSITSGKAVVSRMVKARKAEKILGKDLDTVVGKDDTMYESLLKLKSHEDPAQTPMQNAVRKYYKFTHAREFPRLRNFHNPRHH